MKPMVACWTRRLLVVLACTIPAQASAFFVDGSGHYGLLGETQTKPAFSDQEGTYQAIQQSFRITGEARMNDRSSAFMELRLFPDLREAYLGDTSSPPECAPADGSPGVETNCADRNQNPIEPSYEPYDPRITKAYLRYAFDWCIIEAGRRDRDWGLGIFMDSGEDPFETAASIYDGIDCQVNIQKSQTIGFSIGYDKLQETGTIVDPDAGQRRFGSNEPADDLDQYFFSIEWDDRKANAGAAFTKHIGIYFAQISSSKEILEGGTNTDIKILDLYTGFFLSDLAFRNEILFRMGKSAAPSFARLGGTYPSTEAEVGTRKVQSIAIAGNFEWTLSRSGAAIGPAEYNRGDANRHVWFLDYAYAPGDPEGYYQDGVLPGGEDEYGCSGDQRCLGNQRRNNKNDNVEAVEFHRNYKPALILFNARPESDHLREDGVFNPSRVVNAAVFGTGYRYESIEGGNFEVKLLTATLNEKVPGDLKDFYNERKTQSDEQVKQGEETGSEAQQIAGRALDADGARPAGFFGRTLGYELDLKYTYKVGREAALGMAAAAAIPGDAWQVNTDYEPKNNFLLQTFVTFQF